MSDRKRSARDQPAGSRPAQSPRLEQSSSTRVDGFVPGSVLKVVMKNFMTYGYAELQPGPRLNLLLGPNGTGKSSFVCAICVGLAGHPRLLGRADKPAEFIKRGEQSAEVEVTLCSSDPNQPLVIRRKIKQDGSSEWRINGEVVNLKKVEQETRALNVQLDNLCQFLPQDRVVAFAELKPHELLLETEQAIGDASLHSDHVSLMNMRDGIRGLEQTVKEHDALLTRLTEQNAELERDVERFQQLEALKAEVAIMEKMRPWLKFGIARQTYKDTKEKVQEVKKQLKEKEVQMAQYKRPVDESKQALEEAILAKETCKKELVRLDKLRSTAEEGESALSQDVEQLEEDLKSVHQSAEERIRKIQRHDAFIAEKERQLENMPPPPDTQGELDEIREREREIAALLREKQQEKIRAEERADLPRRNHQALAEKLRKLDDVRNQRVAALQRNVNRDVERAARLVKAKQQEGMFQREVYGPVLAEIEIDNPQWCKYLEQQCSGALWAAFVTQSQHDRDLLNKLFREHNMKISVRNYSGDAEAPIPDPPELPELARFGIEHTLNMCYKAPQVIKHIIKDSHSTHRTFVGTEATNRMLQELTDQTNVQSVWTPSHQVNTSISRYGDRVKSTKFINTRESKYLNASGGSAAQRENMQQQLVEFDAQITQAHVEGQKLAEECKELDAEQGQLKSRRDALLKTKMDYQKQRNGLTKAIADKKQIVESLKKHSGSTEQQEAKIKAKMSAKNDERCTRIIKLGDVFAEIVAKTQLYSQLNLSEKEKMVQLEYHKDEYKRHENAGCDLLDKKKKLDVILKEDNQRMLALRAEANKIAPLPDPVLDAKFQSLPVDLDELEELIGAKKAEADTMFISNPDVLRIYTKRREEIQTLTGKLETERQELGDKQVQIDACRERWLPELRECIRKMNASFEQNFAAIGCTGMLELREVGEEFEKYEVCIKVKFRAEETLQILSCHRQSGGERSVSTMLYLIALQEFTKCPFRVVDEINQGMDACNERKIFTKMVQAATSPDTPQCFLLTPKLLPQLDYSEEITVLNIFNGPLIAPIAKKWEHGAKWWEPRAVAV